MAVYEIEKSAMKVRLLNGGLKHGVWLFSNQIVEILEKKLVLLHWLYLAIVIMKRKGKGREGK